MGHSACAGVGPDPKQESYNDDPFMRHERTSRGIVDGFSPSQRAPRGRPKTGSGQSRFPRKTIEGEPRVVEYDDPFMRIERTSRLPPQQPSTSQASSSPWTSPAASRDSCGVNLSHSLMVVVERCIMYQLMHCEKLFYSEQLEIFILPGDSPSLPVLAGLTKMVCACTNCWDNGGWRFSKARGTLLSVVQMQPAMLVAYSTHMKHCSSARPMYWSITPTFPQRTF